MDLQNRTLLLMGGGAYARDIARYQAEKGFRIVALGRDQDTPISRIADAFYQVNTQDVDGVCEVVRRENVDGIFVGASEVNIIPAIRVSERTGARFYASQAQWDILADKAAFKDCCRACGVPVVPEYHLPENYTREDVAALPYPVLLKPVDSSGARGMNACFRAEDFEALYQEALRWSPKGQVIIEELITGADEVFFQYTLQNGVCSLTSCFTKVFVKSDNPGLILPIFHMYPSKYIDAYYADVHQSVCRMFERIGVRDGVMTLQSFCRDGRFYIFEAGYRMGGAQNYILSQHYNGTNSLEYMINYALTGQMDDTPILPRDNARFSGPCCNYYVGLRAGTIGRMDGVDAVRTMPGVLNVTVMGGVGDVVEDTNALERICLRIHVAGDDPQQLAQRLVAISRKLDIVSTTGEDMQLEPLEYHRCLAAIRSATIFGGEQACES